MAAMRIAGIAAAVALAGCAHAPPMDATASLAAAETAFAAHSVREDMRAAFLAAFADDGVFVRDGWTVSNAYLAKQPAPPIVLDWRPKYVEVAASGELGLSTGPWKITSKAKPDAPPSYGQFVSIWRRAPGGPWKVEVDLGIAHPQPALWEAPLQTRGAPADVAPGGETFAQAEADFHRRSASAGVRAAYESRGAADMRLYRAGIMPVAGRAAALSAAAVGDARLQWTIERLETARSGDFGYARGAYGEGGRTAGYFLRVWRREAGSWRIVLDVTNEARG